MEKYSPPLAILGRTTLLFLLFFSPLSALGSFSSSSDLRILSAEKRVDLTSSIVRVYLTLKVENLGTSHASEFLLAFSPTEAEHLAIIKASSVEGKRKKKAYTLSVSSTDLVDTPNGARLFSVSLISPLKTGDTASIEVLYVLTNLLEPFPAEISQAESQLVFYRDSAILLSPYHVVEQMMYVRTPTNKIESFTRVNPTDRAGTELKYGHFHDQPPYSFSPIIIHFENNNPFAVIEELVREVEISHWGSLQMKEYYKLKHAGARHKGVFSRLEYQARPSVNGASSFKQLLAKLPPRVHSVYYRDEIGNISSSHLRTDYSQSELEIEPRYPLFGGWKATFVIGYSLPLEDFVFESPAGQHYLNLSFGCPLIETQVDSLTIKVMLPEGSKSPRAAVPFSADHHLEKTYSYLDVVGRTTVVIRKMNVVPEHNIPFQVYYNFSPVFMLAEPLMLITAYFMLFSACIAYLHTDLSLVKT
ncbi:Dolichyl-diphosphooligosaccharide--protein glycosyltransferase subunit 1B [Apostasia shenzhenica]|uniref:Dolichyl-diphosphooligosaccharide--protein glycosyltransferase subunit 1 n=1 Tax=Apostasia shenzhenica TaxID=1088818 RepID=A0A2I0AD23_9ASPA|nr:Dolichyl-diphosphooligosaccharide--protein glycosyltransferase subunit 1B [Apostasia shenzhenica]